MLGKSSLFRFNAFTGHSVPDALQNNLGAFKKKKKTVPNNNFYFKVYNTYTHQEDLFLLEGKKTRQEKIFTRERGRDEWGGGGIRAWKSLHPEGEKS